MLNSVPPDMAAANVRAMADALLVWVSGVVEGLLASCHPRFVRLGDIYTACDFFQNVSPTKVITDQTNAGHTKTSTKSACKRPDKASRHGTNEISQATWIMVKQPPSVATALPGPHGPQPPNTIRPFPAPEMARPVIQATMALLLIDAFIRYDGRCFCRTWCFMILLSAQRSYPPMTGGWAVVGVAAVGLIGHSTRCLVRLLPSLTTFCERVHFPCLLPR